MNSILDRTENSTFLSLAAYHILEEFGMTKITSNINSSLQRESQFIVNAIASVTVPNTTCVLAGSFADGLANISLFTGEKADIDLLSVQNSCLAIQTPDTAARDPSLCQFLIEEVHENPAYVRLRLLSRGNNPFHMSFIHDRTLVQSENGLQYLSSSEIKILLKILNMGNYMFNILPVMFHNMASASISGPANSINFQNLDCGAQNGFSMEKVDIVFSIPCPSWPKAANEWIRRRRVYDWPPLDLLYHISSQGCHLVPKSRSESSVKNLNLVISFSHVEPLLIHSMNDIMMKTYAILKILQKFVFQAEVGGKVSSYIIKTSLFWESEETDNTKWTPENLLECVRGCLRRIKDWFDTNFAPHYFIRNQNLLKRTITASDRQRVIECLTDTFSSLEELFQNLPPFVNTLRSRTIEKVLNEYFDSTSFNRSEEIEEVKFCEFINHIFITINLYIVPFLVGAFVGKHLTSNWSSLDSFKGAIFRLFKNETSTVSRVLTLTTLLQKYLFLELIGHENSSQKNKKVYYGTKLSSRIVCLSEIARPVLALSNLLVLIIQSIYFCDYRKMEKNIQTANYHLCKSKTIRMDSTDNSNMIQKAFGLAWRQLVVGDERNNTYAEDIVVISDFVLTHIELEFLPPVLKLEMECRFNVDKDRDPICRPPNENVLLVGAEAFFYFVSFCFYHHRDKNIEKYSNVKKLQRLCQRNSAMHLHVALNLLGYCELLMGQHREALATYHRSLCVQSRNLNLRTVSKATPYHVAILLYKCFSDEWSKTK